MVFSKVGPNQSIEWGQIRVSKSNAPGGIGNPTGPTRILQQVTLSPDGKHYSGTFTLDAYDTSGTQVAHIIGVIAATRITVHTTVQDIL